MTSVARRWLSGVCVLALAGCSTFVTPSTATQAAAASTSASSAAAELLRVDGYGPTSEPIDVSGLFSLDEPMRRFLATEMQRLWPHEARELQLVDALYRNEALKLHYDASRTRSAAESFAQRRGNCLSLVILTAAFAKALDLEVDYRRALAEQSWSRAGGLIMASGHVNITLSRPAGQRLHDRDAVHSRLTVDFLPQQELHGLRTRSIDESELIAMYENNRAAEALADGRVADGHAWAVAALRRRPDFAAAWNTLGAVHRRAGAPRRAVQAFREALTRAPEQAAAMANLAQTLSELGETSEAAAWSARLAALEAYPPFADLWRGWQAIERGAWDDARAAFERELARSGDAADLRHGLAIAALQLGNEAQARRQLARAFELSRGGEDRHRFLAKMERLIDHQRAR